MHKVIFNKDMQALLKSVAFFEGMWYNQCDKKEGQNFEQRIFLF